MDFTPGRWRISAEERANRFPDKSWLYHDGFNHRLAECTGRNISEILFALHAIRKPHRHSGSLRQCF